MFKKHTFATLMLAAALGSSAVQAAPDSAEAVKMGREKFKLNCMSCHGEKGDGKGDLIGFLKITPADLTALSSGGGNSCVTDRVLKAVLGRHSLSKGDHKMPLLGERLSPEDIYLLAEYVKSIQK